MVTTAISSAAPGMLGGISHPHLVNEMCLNPNFQLVHPKDPMPLKLLTRTCIRPMHPDEFWGALSSKLMLATRYGAAADYGDLLQLLGDIKDGVKSIAPASQDRSRIDEVKQMIETMDTKGFTSIVDWIIDGMCNALGMQQQNIARRDETRAMWQASKQKLVALDATGINLQDRSEKAVQCMCDALKLVVDRIERMRLDEANKKLRGMSAIIRTNGISYLKDKFEIEMNNGTFTLEFTKELMVHTMEMLRQDDDGGLQMMDARKETIDAANNIGEVYRGIIVAGVLDTIDTLPNWGGKDRSLIAREGTNDERVSFPESFRFDLKRMEAMQRFLRHDVACAVILSQVGLLVNDFVTNAEAKIVCMAKVYAVLHNKTVLPDKSNEISILVDEVLAQMPQAYIQPMYLDTTRTLLVRNLNPQHPISKSTLAHIKKAWWTWMMEGPNSQTATAYQLDLPESTDYIKPFIRAHAFCASPFVRQSMVVHEKHYISILNEITGANAQHLGAIPV